MAAAGAATGRGHWRTGGGDTAEVSRRFRSHGIYSAPNYVDYISHLIYLNYIPLYHDIPHIYIYIPLYTHRSWDRRYHGYIMGVIMRLINFNNGFNMILIGIIVDGGCGGFLK